MMKTMIALTFVGLALACSFTEPQVSFAQAGALNSSGNSDFAVPQVQEHISALIDQIVLTDSFDVTLQCVDARANGQEGIVGTPGGDLAEFAGAAYVYLREYKGILNATMDDIRPLFVKFLETQISPERPFYFHTDDSKLRDVAFAKISERLGRRVTILPDDAPNSTEIEIWLEELAGTDAQGCGHIRKMMEDPQGYGMDNESVMRNTLKVFYEQYWAAQDKSKFSFSIKLGPLVGKAIVIVTTNSSAEECKDKVPRVVASTAGSSLFVYTPQVVGYFRSNVLTPFFENQDSDLNATLFLDTLNVLQTVQLNQTLHVLSPANDVDLFSVPFQVEP